MRIDLEKPILSKNDEAARANRELLDAHPLYADYACCADRTDCCD